MDIPVPNHEGRVIGNWRLGHRIGKGGFGAVYEAHSRTIRGKRAAVKVLHPHLASPDLVRRFIDEASAASQADHENIVEIYDGGIEPDGLCYVIMEYLRGTSLAQLLQDGPIDVKEVRHIGAQIAAALQAAHERGIVHRDLKLENILLVHRPRDPRFVKVLDFGIAKLRYGGQHTQTGMLMGTPRYMSPEQWQMLTDIDGRADVYALGVMLFECLTRRPLFAAENQYQWMQAHLHDLVPDPAQFEPVPPWLCQLVQAMLQKERGRRPQTMARVQEALAGESFSPATLLPEVTPATLPAVTPDPQPVAVVPVAFQAASRPSLWPSIMRPSGSVAVAPPRRRRNQIFFAAGGLLTVLGLLWMAFPRPPRSAPGAAARNPPPDAGPGPQPPPALPPEIAALGPAPGLGRFGLGKYEVSMAEYRQFVEKTGPTGPLPWDVVEDFAPIAELPMNQVTQAQAAAYCRWRYPGGRLPTEAEWDYAATDGGTRRFPWGDRWEAGRANAGGRIELSPVTAHPAGASPAGILNLIGNVAEWTQEGAVRGGAVNNSARELSAAWRKHVAPDKASPFIGFRCALSLPRLP